MWSLSKPKRYEIVETQSESTATDLESLESTEELKKLMEEGHKAGEIMARVGEQLRKL